jgi:hypothetical protein
VTVQIEQLKVAWREVSDAAAELRALDEHVVALRRTGAAVTAADMAAVDRSCPAW